MKETQKKRMMHKKGRKCVFISKKGKTNVKAIKKPYIRNRDSKKNKKVNFKIQNSPHQRKTLRNATVFFSLQ